MSPSASDPSGGTAHDGVDPTWVARVAAGPPGAGGTRVVCVDGPAGSGKTTLAAALADDLAALGPVLVVHGDDVYEGWPVVAGEPDRVTAFATLANRLRRDLLDAWARGRTVEVPRWDWYAGAPGHPVRATPPATVVLEGVGLAAAPLRELASLTVWVEADAVQRRARVLARDGDAVAGELDSWQRDEAEWHRLDGTRAAADVRVST